MNSGSAQRPTRLTKVAHETEAAMIVATLAEAGISANTTGEHTAGMRAETPGLVQIWVHAENLGKAREILHSLNEEAGEIDWSQVDTGDRSPISVEEFVENSEQKP